MASLGTPAGEEFVKSGIRRGQEIIDTDRGSDYWEHETIQDIGRVAIITIINRF